MMRNPSSFDQALVALRDNTMISLQLTRGDIDLKKVKTMAAAIAVNRTLTEIDLSHNSFGSEGAAILGLSLKNNTTLKYFDISNNQIGDEGLQHLLEGLTESKTLISLNLSNTGITDHGASSLSNFMKSNKSISEINLGINSIGSRGAAIIAEQLKNDTHVKKFIIWKNLLGDEGIKSIAEALKKNTVLTSIDLSSTGMSESGALALVEALKINKTLTSLAFNYNSIAKDREAKINTLLLNNTNIARCINDKIAVFETAKQPSSINEIDGLLNSLSEFQNELDTLCYPMQAIGYQTIFSAICLLKSLRIQNQGRHNDAWIYLSVITENQPYFDIAQDALIELFNYQLDHLYKDNETEHESQSRFKILQQTLDCVSENNDSKSSLSTIIRNGKICCLRNELTRPRNPDEIEALRHQGTQECPVFFHYKPIKNSHPMETARARSKSLSGLNLNPYSVK